MTGFAAGSARSRMTRSSHSSCTRRSCQIRSCLSGCWCATSPFTITEESHHVGQIQQGIDRRDLHDRINCHGRRIGCSRGQCRFCERPGLSDFLCQPGIGCAISDGLYRRYNPGEKGRQRARRQRPGARAEAPSVFSGRADAHRTALVCVRDGRQGGKAGQARRSGQRRAWRRDEFRAYGPDRDEPARSGGDVGHGDGGHGRVPPGHGRHAAQMAQFRAEASI